MKDNSYIPAPIDTSEVQLPPDVAALIEVMARNVHEVWAETRLKQGWTHGERRDDVLKTHPCLVPYDELPEEEKDYDRYTALSTLKLITKLGFSLKKQ